MAARKGAQAVRPSDSDRGWPAWLWLLIGVVLGLVVGALAKLVMPGDDPGGVVVTGLLGIVGALLTGPLNVKEISGTDGSFLVQLGAVATTLVVSGVGSFVILKVIDMVIGLRVTEEEEREGLDVSLHGERVE